jgi:hypothetical protein
MTMVAASDHRPRLIIADDDPVVRSMLSMSLGAAFELDGVAAAVLAQSLNDSIKAHSDGRAGGS